MEGERDRGNLSLVIHSSSLPPRTLTKLVYNQMRSKHAMLGIIRLGCSTSEAKGNSFLK